jgi:hypothetical protein
MARAREAAITWDVEDSELIEVIDHDDEGSDAPTMVRPIWRTRPIEPADTRPMSKRFIDSVLAEVEHRAAVRDVDTKRIPGAVAQSAPRALPRTMCPPRKRTAPPRARRAAPQQPPSPGRAALAVSIAVCVGVLLGTGTALAAAALATGSLSF